MHAAIGVAGALNTPRAGRIAGGVTDSATIDAATDRGTPACGT